MLAKLGAVTIGKAVYFALIVLAVDVSFLKSLALVLASAIGTGVFSLAVALIQARSHEQTHRRLQRLERRQRDMARKLGVDRRAPAKESEGRSDDDSP